MSKYIKKYSTGSGTIDEVVKSVDAAIPQNQQPAPTAEHTLPATPTTSLIEFPSPASPRIDTQSAPQTEMLPAEETSEVLKSAQDSPLQKEKDSGKQILPLKI